jgi:phage-related protein
VDYQIEYFSEHVESAVLAFPDTIAARYVFLTRRMQAVGPNLGSPHTEPLGEGLFELRLKGAEGIARVFFCALIGRRIVMLHAFVKKTQKTPPAELTTARKRLKELRHGRS